MSARWDCYSPETDLPLAVTDEYLEGHERAYSTYLQHAQMNEQLCQELGIGEFGYVVGKDPDHFLDVTRKMHQRQREYIAAGKDEDERGQRKLVWPFQDTVDVGHNPRGMVVDFIDF